VALAFGGGEAEPRLPLAALFNSMAHMNQSGQAGFTLLELVVALALTGLLTLVAYGSLNLSLKVVRRGQTAAEQLQELRVGQDILTRSLSSTVKGTLGNRLYFIGEPSQMRFFTLVPLEAHSPGGVYHWRVLLGQDESHRGVVAVEQTKNVNWYRDPEGVEIRQIIFHNVTSVRFTYGRGGEESQTWEAKRDRGLPDWVKVYLTQGGQQPQELVIPIHVSESKQPERPL
jgi:general secretion pathway protein J